MSKQVEQVERQLVVFDFDWSLADQDSDRWIFEVLAPDIRRKLKNIKPDHEWTDLVAQGLRELHERGITREDIEGALRIIPFHPAMIRGVKTLKAAAKPQTTFLCLSSANSVFISTILQSKGLQDLFAEIVTNPAEWDPSGLLKLTRHIDPNGPQHHCPLRCNPNICKGQELDAFIKRKDGSNDFCPAVRLRSQDIVLCRRYRELEHRIGREGKSAGLVCEVRYWAGAWEVEEIFGQLPDTVKTI
ncbi:phosphatase phospho-type [Russula earlei]|uniref:Phosphatase phospho-type n=1 Tax=Russula earlei TaxID=71964 RepID=A0ACC0UIV9_9AGAM|nr:phosphatase phospho-type [Russula earlei]